MTVFSKWPIYSSDEREVVNEVLGSGNVNYWTGSQCRDFEREFADYHGRNYGIALSNGTVALELALIALGVSPDDEVIVPSRTYFATASCVVARGAKPIPADVDLTTQNVTVDTIKSSLTPKTKGVIVVHLAGWPCAMPDIKAFCESRNLFLIEDCAQAHGATINGVPVGSFGHCAAFSFCQDKIMSTGGEGGMLLLDDTEKWKMAWAYKDHGKSYDAVYCQHHEPGFRWVHQTFGTNWRMTEMQAAIGRIQLKKLKGWLCERQINANYLNEELADLPGLRLTIPNSSEGHAYYRYYAFIQKGALLPDWSQIRIIESINERGVPCFVGSCGEIYREVAFKDNFQNHYKCHKNAHDLFQTSLAFLVHPGISKKAMKYTVDVVRDVLKMATGI